MSAQLAKYDPITVARFWSKVDVRVSLNDCWNWRGATKTLGYGRIKINGKNHTASRVAWELANCKDLGALHALHSCDNPRCCNPNHIFAGDHMTNMREAKDRGLLRSIHSSGGKNGNSKLTESDVLEIRSLFEQRVTNVEIARRYGVTHSMISHIRTGRSWTGTRTEQNGKCE